MNYEAEKSPTLLPKIIFGLVGISLLLAVFAGVDLWRKEQQLDALVQENQQITQRIDQLEKTDQVGVLYQAKEILDRALAARVEWSKVAADLLALEGTTEDLTFRQFQVTPEGAVNLSGETQDIKSVAILLQSVRDAEAFAAPFVPSVNGETGVYNFQLQFNYLGL